MRKKYLWKKAIQKACSATEGVDRSLANYLIKSASIKRHFYWINGNKSLDNLYQSFVITIAFELHMFNTKEVAWSLAFAILDNGSGSPARNKEQKSCKTVHLLYSFDILSTGYLLCPHSPQ